MSLKRRYSSVEINPLFAIATILDPRFKRTPFLNEDNFKSAKEKIIEEMQLSFPEEPEGKQTEALSSYPPNEPASKKSKNSSSFWSHYNTAFSDKTTSSNQEETKSCEEELNTYLSEKLVDPKLGDHVGNVWHASSHHRLKILSKKYLSVPPSTVYSERLFSTAGNICDSKRNRLDPNKVKMLVFLKTNLD